MPSNFDYYHMFYYVGKYKSITKAASSMYLSQSTVSRGMQCLENELGCMLFERTRGGIVLTGEGETLYKGVVSACESIFLAEEELAQMKHRIKDTIYIGVSDLSFTQFVQPAMRRFQKEYPNIQIRIISSGFHYTDDMIRALLAGKTDLACTAMTKIESELDDRIRVRRIASYESVMIASSSFKELSAGSYSLDELFTYPHLGLAIESAGISEIEKMYLKREILMKPFISADAVSIFLELLKYNRCLALVPALLRDESALNKDYFEVGIKEALPQHTVHILTVDQRSRSQAHEAFLRELEQIIRIRVQECSRMRLGSRIS